MCRVLMYKGEAVRLDDLLYQPNNSLVKQAYDPQMLDELSFAGFGLLAWDNTSHDPDIPFGYRSTNLPVFDRNLKDLAEKLRVTALIAHVRGVPYSETATVGEQNLHPFRYRGYRLAMAHNGDLARFSLMRFAFRSISGRKSCNRFGETRIPNGSTHFSFLSSKIRVAT